MFRSASCSLRQTDRQLANPLPGYGERAIRDSRGCAGNSRLSNAARLLIVFHNMGFYLRTLIHAHHRKSVEIRLLQAPVLECEFLKEGSRRSEDCAPLQLGCDDPWIYIMAAIYRAHDPMHPDPAVRD